MNPKKIVRKVFPVKAIHTAEETYRRGRIVALQARHGFPARRMRVVAVTGTNGKTTTCCYINAVLKAGGLKTALFTTAVIEMNGESQLNTSHRTVPLTAQLLSFFKEARRNRVDVVILEVTSQALHQHKVLGIPIEIAVMTNLTQDHLDYHQTMDRYASAKARLFSRYMRPKYCVLNGDDEWFNYFRDQSVGIVKTYGKGQANDVRIQDEQLAGSGSVWNFVEMRKALGLRTQIPGEFNVFNATAAAVVGGLMGLSAAQIKQGVASLASVPGRMESIDAGQPYTVLVDYAHTPDALERVLQAGRQIADGRVITVFGATGDRDTSKRPVMGKIAAQNADITFLTDDETYTEDGDTIRAAVRAGLDDVGGKYIEVPDRRKAIEAAFAEAKKGDVVVLAGIGHQDYRNQGGKALPWDERQIAREILVKS